MQTRRKSSAELSLEVGLEGSSGADELDVGTVLDDHLIGLQLWVILLVDVGESPLLGDDDFLATGELVTGTAEGFNDDGGVGVFGPYGEDNLTDVDTGDSPVGFPPSTTHTGLKPISTGTTQHLVDPNNVEGVNANTEMERIFSRGLGHVFVGANTGGLEGLGGDLLVLVGNEMGAVGEVVYAGTFPSKIENANLRVGYTTVVSRLGERLVLTVPVAASWTTTHDEI